MSHIFDALGRRGDGDPKDAEGEGQSPFTPRGEPWPQGGPEIGFRLTRELEGLRERIELELPRSGRRVFSVAASVTGEGATTVALNLSRMISRAPDAKVLLVDCDLSYSSQTLTQTVLGEGKPLPGLVDLLAGNADLSKVVLSTDETNLHFLPSGIDPVSRFDVISSDRMRQFLEDMGQVYRFVVVDSPPILEHPEGPVLGALTSGVVLVVRAHRTRREVVQKAMGLLQGARCPVLGVVLNQRRYAIPEFLYRRL